MLGRSPGLPAAASEFRDMELHSAHLPAATPAHTQTASIHLLLSLSSRYVVSLPANSRLPFVFSRHSLLALCVSANSASLRISLSSTGSVCCSRLLFCFPIFVSFRPGSGIGYGPGLSGASCTIQYFPTPRFPLLSDLQSTNRHQLARIPRSCPSSSTRPD